MVQTLLNRLLQMLILLVLQALICNHVHIMGYATPIIQVLFVAWMPLNSNRTGNLVWAFALGLLLDMFANTPGISAASLTLTAMVQYSLVHMMAPKDAVDDMVPNYGSMGVWNYIQYLALLTAVHHLMYFVLEFFSFSNPLDMLLSLLTSVLLSLLIMLTLETMRNR